MIILIKGEAGKSSAINLAKHSWETEIVPGDDSSIRMILDDKREFTMNKDKYDEITTALEKADGFLVLKD